MFFVLFCTVFSHFLSIFVAFETSLTTCFPCVPTLSVAVYVVKSRGALRLFRYSPVVIGKQKRTVIRPAFVPLQPGQRRGWDAIFKEKASCFSAGRKQFIARSFSYSVQVAVAQSQSNPQVDP